MCKPDPAIYLAACRAARRTPAGVPLRRRRRQSRADRRRRGGHDRGPAGGARPRRAPGVRRRQPLDRADGDLAARRAPVGRPRTRSSCSKMHVWPTRWWTRRSRRRPSRGCRSTAVRRTRLWCLPLDGALYVVSGPRRAGRARPRRAPRRPTVTLRGDHGGRIVHLGRRRTARAARRRGVDHGRAAGGRQAAQRRRHRPRRWSSGGRASARSAGSTPADATAVTGADLPDDSGAAPPRETPGDRRRRRNALPPARVKRRDARSADERRDRDLAPARSAPRAGHRRGDDHAVPRRSPCSPAPTGGASRRPVDRVRRRRRRRAAARWPPATRRARAPPSRSPGPPAPTTPGQKTRACAVARRRRPRRRRSMPCAPNRSAAVESTLARATASGRTGRNGNSSPQPADRGGAAPAEVVGRQADQLPAAARVQRRADRRRPAGEGGRPRRHLDRQQARAALLDDRPGREQPAPDRR